MPLVQVKLIEGVFSDAQKQEMVRKLTDAMVSIEGEPMREVAKGRATARFRTDQARSLAGVTGFEQTS
jgi:hypothetical protein